MQTEEFLAHYGVKGMRWGVQKNRPDGVSRKTDREAKKDATEFARAKMYYGEGAGTRRKLINKSVEAKKSRDSAYAKAFDKHVNDQDLSVHATKAKKERKRTDRSDRNKKRAGAVARRVTNEPGTQAAMVAIALSGAAFLARPQSRAFMKKQFNRAADLAKQKKGAYLLNQYIKRNLA